MGRNPDGWSERSPDLAPSPYHLYQSVCPLELDFDHVGADTQTKDSCH
jgi:hypothetical protein